VAERFSPKRAGRQRHAYDAAHASVKFAESNDVLSWLSAISPFMLKLQ
jgi:hypothetical protein